jgi:uncharacterized protein with HEPN domain
VISEVTWLLLEDMLAHAREAVEFLADFDARELEADRMRRSAVIREAEIVGEAASKVNLEQRKLLPAIPWREASTFRNLLIHGYREIRTPDLVDTIRNDFPPLIVELERILNTDPQGKP